MGSEIGVGFSVVGCCRDDSTVSQYVYVPAISRAPLQLHLIFGSLRLHARLEHNVTPATSVARVEFRAREIDAVETACDEHLAVGQQRSGVLNASAREAADG
jgi:hypothetical protein